MAASGPWSVKGISPETRLAAKQAARRSGLTLGEWLKTAISEQADGGDAKGSAAGTMTASATSSSIESFERATTRLEDIAQQLARIARQESDAASAYSYGAPPRQETESFSRLVNRLDTNERQSVEAFSAVNERLSVLSRQFAQATKAASTRPEDSQGFQTLEKAVRNIIEHMEASEKRNRDNHRSLQDRIAEMSSRAQSAPNDSVLRQAPAFSQLEQRFADLSRRVEQTESFSSRGLQDLVKQELHGLAGRIDQVRDAAEQYAVRAQTQAVQANQQELRAIENRILGLLQEAQATFQGGSSGADLQRVQHEIGQLNARIDDARKGLASDHDVRALRQAVEQLSTRVQQSADSRPLVEMDRRIVELAQRLHDQQQYLQQQPQLGDLDQRFAELEQRLGDALQQPANSQAHDALAQQIAHVSERMDRTEQQISHFATIERAITQLYEGLEQTRNATKQVAEDAASRVAQQFAFTQSTPQSVSLSGAPEILALEQGLQALRETTSTADQRNQETLLAVHDTLENIVGKLVELETAAIGQRVAAAVTAPPPPAAAELPPIEAADAAYPPPPQARMPVVDQIEETASAAYGLEQSAEPERETYHEPFLEIPSSMTEAAAPPVEQAITEEPAKPASTDDFIAAARRAAQAAQQQKSVLGSFSPTAAKFSEEGSRKLLGKLKLPFFKKAKTDKAKPAAIAPDIKPMPEIKPAAAAADGGKRRRLMLIGLVLLAAVPALLLNFGGKSTTTKTPADPAPAAAPAQKQGSLAPQPSNASEIMESDGILTGSLPNAAPDSVAEIVSGSAPQVDVAMLPAELGSAKLKQAAAAGDSNAQFIVASRFMDGKSVTQDKAQAAQWFEKAANGGLAPAQYRIATMYERGQGVEKDIRTALRWYERAGALGNVRSMHNAAVIAAGNEAGKPDYARAFKWFSLASSHGLKDSQFNLAVLLERGLGAQADVVEAAFWYSAAGLQNDEDAQRRAKLLIEQMPAADVTAIRQRLESWKPQVAPREANIFEIDESRYGGTA